MLLLLPLKQSFPLQSASGTNHFNTRQLKWMLVIIQYFYIYNSLEALCPKLRTFPLRTCICYIWYSWSFGVLKVLVLNWTHPLFLWISITIDCWPFLINFICELALYTNEKCKLFSSSFGCSLSKSLSPHESNWAQSTSVRAYYLPSIIPLSLAPQFRSHKPTSNMRQLKSLKW